MKRVLFYAFLLEALLCPGKELTWDITNQIVTLKFSPAISRISYFGRTNGPNALWMNPEKKEAVFAGSKPWINHGGERFWPLPALTIAAAFESGWPPPECFENIKWKIKNRTSNTLEIESECIQELGIVLNRRFHLPPGRASVEFRNTMIRLKKNHIPVQIWLTAQLPEPEYCIASPPAEYPGWRKLNLLNQNWKGVTIREHKIVFEPDQILQGAKIGFFAEAAVAVYPGYLFIQKTMFRSDFCYPECSNMQLYGNPVENFGKYMEIELLGDYANLKTGEATSLFSSWELILRK